MTNIVNEQKVRTQKIVEMFNTGDLSGLDSLFSSIYVDHQKPSLLGVDGSEEFKHIVLDARKSLPNLHVTIEDVIGEGDTVVVRFHWQSTPLEGKKIERETIDVLRFAHGKVIEHWGAEAWRKETPFNDQTL